jgi:outer membrane protein assembly factor BamA
MLFGRELAAVRWISKLGLILERDSRDSLLYPTVGNRVCFEVDYPGVGGDVHSMNLDLQAVAVVSAVADGLFHRYSWCREEFPR